MKGAKSTKRSQADLYATILEVIKRHPEGARITRISYGVGVPIDRLKMMVEALSSYGLILKITGEEEEVYYCVTPRGLDFLETYWKMKGFLASFESQDN
ncbi:MAG: winged helix-turn-helix domain-containing protein [Nitrososphaerales archaeon]